MTDKIDTSPENVAKMVSSLRDPWCHDEELGNDASDMLEALAARVAELEYLLVAAGDHAAKVERRATTAEAKLAERDAEVERLKEANGILEDGLQEVGDDYPGSSCQEWCRTMVKQARAALEGEKP